MPVPLQPPVVAGRPCSVAAALELERALGGWIPPGPAASASPSLSAQA